jgi:hypothetical protein
MDLNVAFFLTYKHSNFFSVEDLAVDNGENINLDSN